MMMVAYQLMYRLLLLKIVDIAAHEMHFEPGGGSSFSTGDRLDIWTALQRPSTPVSTSGTEFPGLLLSLVDDISTSHAATERAEKQIE